MVGEREHRKSETGRRGKSIAKLDGHDGVEAQLLEDPLRVYLLGRAVTEHRRKPGAH